MGAQLSSTVYVADPDTRQTVELAAGTLPEPRLAALVTNPAAWVDGKLPRLPKTLEQKDPSENPGGPTGGGPDGASGDASEPSDAGDTEQAAPAAKKTAAKKTATAPTRGRAAAGEGDSGE